MGERIGVIVGVCLALCLSLPIGAVAETCDPWAAKVVSVQGTAEVQQAGATQWQPMKRNDIYCPGDIIRVAAESRVDVVLANESVLRLNENTTLTLESVSEKRTSIVNMLKGAAHFFSRRPRSLEVKTPFTIAGVRGTEFFIRVDQSETFLSIFEGAVQASNAAGSLALASGQSAVAAAGKAPVLRTVARPRDAVHWALYYPPVLDGTGAGTDEVRGYAQRASELLAAGRVEAAEANLTQALRLDPSFGDALALQSIIAVVQNRKDEALTLAQKAVEAAPNSAAAHIAMSYANQADFNLEGARQSLEQAVSVAPDNAVAWARLSELHLSFADMDKALEAAKKAVAMNPNVSRTQTVLGFAYLTQVDTLLAGAAFEKAISMDEADPLPRLGLGLAKIREGDVPGGREQIEIAASLDPNNSLVRSYLGKAFYEEKRDGLDAREYQIAKELDPNDPTPYFYDAIRKQTENRPVEALQDLQTAIDLNDNRAVYRSKLLLDSDLAARSASQARIYSDLGFQQRALVEGYNAVNTDPTNYSAHRFLADSYSVLPRHEIARVSELLQSQLLQPSNLTPIQPSLAESNLFLISSGGAASTSFNEFNPLFNRNRHAVQISGIAGSDDTFGGEGVVSGIYNKLSLSAGYSHFETDGWRTNADQEDDIANVFAQYEITPNTSIQAEYRFRETEKGDTQLRFMKDDFASNLRQEDERDTLRLGFRHAFMPSSTLIGNFQYQTLDGREQDQPDPAVDVDISSDQDAYGAELQYLHRSNYLDVVAGGGYFDIDRDDILDTEITIPDIIIPQPPPLPPIIIPGTTISDRQQIVGDVGHTNVYVYTHWSPTSTLTLTLGVSGDFFDAESQQTPSEDQFNPKFGITWKPHPNTTLRGAAFRTLKRSLITDQTLEPTQVSGFNQFFDEPNATDAWRYGVAIDQKFSNSIFGGAEFAYRDMDAPFAVVDPGLGTTELFEAEWEEKLARGYLFWAPCNYAALSAEYIYEEFDRERSFADGIENVKTHYVPLGINLFHPWGISISLKATYINQDGSFEDRLAAGLFNDGEDDSWVADAAISYRLPKRLGFLTIGATNIFDTDFNYYDTDPENPRLKPDSSVFAQLTLSFP
jgi:tetratricopeptide (TPR) repeat protein